VDERVDGRVEKGRATRDALLAAARELFGSQGYDGTSIEAILEAAGVARGALYHHFVNKAELFDAVLGREMAALAEATADVARAVPDPLDSLRAGCDTFLRLALDPAVQRITLLDPPAVVGWQRWREIDREHTLGGLQAAIRRLADAGRADRSQVDMLAHMLLAAFGEAAMYVATADDPDQALPSAQDAVGTLLTRLFTPGSGTKRGPAAS
jgi:AcrR family transcriptional regulator